MSYHMPEVQKLQLKISEARRSGNAQEGTYLKAPF